MSKALEPVRIEGLRELQATLKALDGESQKQIRVVLNEAAGIVVRGAQNRAPVVTGAYRKSIKAASGQREASVKAGGAKVPYAGFLDYGGRVGKHKSVVRPFQRGGRYVYPAYYAQRENILAAIAAGLTRLVASVGLEED